MDIHLDASQVAVMIFSFIGSVTLIIVGIKVTGYFKKQEAAANMREKKQELHFKKLDATIYAIGVVLDPDKGAAFKRSFDVQMADYYAENNLINQS